MKAIVFGASQHGGSERTNPTQQKKEQNARYNRSRSASTAAKMMLFRLCVVLVLNTLVVEISDHGLE
jgi:hypothetical protein